jgi:hypothetical protein
MCTIAFDLLIGRDSTEHDFSEAPAFEGSICDATIRMLVGDQNDVNITYPTTSSGFLTIAMDR